MLAPRQLVVDGEPEKLGRMHYLKSNESMETQGRGEGV